MFANGSCFHALLATISMKHVNRPGIVKAWLMRFASLCPLIQSDNE